MHGRVKLVNVNEKEFIDKRKWIYIYTMAFDPN